jgi:hypothetical protein
MSAFFLEPDQALSKLEIVFVQNPQGQPMPSVLRSGPYRFYFYSHEPNEPPHVHVDRDNLSAKFWLNPVELARNRGFSAKELRRISKTILVHQTELLEAWHEHLGPQEG